MRPSTHRFVYSAAMAALLLLAPRAHAAWTHDPLAVPAITAPFADQ
ncbi:MAG: hypothetical protein ABL977_14005 [Candidatus Eisenbacteria bacterium]